VAKAICTIALGPHAALLEIGRPTLEEYAERHGYELIIRDEPETTLAPACERIPLRPLLQPAFAGLAAGGCQIVSR
jgi:hypothetical protein